MDVEIGTSVSKNTNILIVKNDEVLEDKTGKVKKAEELNIDIVTKDNFRKSYLT